MSNDRERDVRAIVDRHNKEAGRLVSHSLFVEEVVPISEQDL